jgi:RNA polymerase sigma factor (sigma-70 family)
MEVSALKYSGGIGLHARSPLLRLQSDERLVALVRRGSGHAFEVLVSRYEARLLAFCRHLLGSREDAEDVLQEVFAAAFNAMTADTRPINVRPWLYRIARNRSLNHLRRMQAVGVDSMDVHYSDNGASTADKVHEREEFRLLVGDIHELPETQKTALVLREMDALSYEQIAEAMETTVPSVKSLLVRARVSLAEAAEARLLSCDEVRIELGEVAEGLRRRPSPLVRRHLRSCKRCESFRVQLKETNKALAAIMPLGPLVLLKKLIVTHLGHSAGSSAGSTAAGSTAAGSTAAAGTTLVAGSTAGGFVSAGMGAIATKAAAGLAAAALVTAGAVEVDRSTSVSHSHGHSQAVTVIPVEPRPTSATTTIRHSLPVFAHHVAPVAKPKPHAVTNHTPPTSKHTLIASTAAVKTAVKPVTKPAATTPTATTPTATTPPPAPPGRTQTQSDPTVLSPTQATTTASVTPTSSTPASTAPVVPSDPTAGTGTPVGTTTPPTDTGSTATGSGTGTGGGSGTTGAGGSDGSSATGAGAGGAGDPGTTAGSDSSSGSGSGSTGSATQ